MPPSFPCRRLTAAALAASAVLGMLPAAAQEGSPPSTPGQGGSSSSSTSTTTTAPGSGGSTPGGSGSEGGEELPPASPGPLPPEDPAQPPPPPPPRPPAADDAGRRLARAQLRAAERGLQLAKAAEAAARKKAEPLAARLNEAQVRVAALAGAQQELALRLSEARNRLRTVAVARYVSGGSTTSVDFLLQATDPGDLSRRRSLVTAATDSQRDATTAYGKAHRAATNEVVTAVSTMESSAAEFAAADAVVQAAAAEVAVRQAEVEHRRLLVDHATAGQPVPPTDIPRLFLDAYRRATAVVERTNPTCRLGWPAVAGIGKIESNHGRYRGALTALNGDVFPRIIGIPLDGTNGTRHIADTDGGILDGDVVVDRAVGPMQFIPSTWARFNPDGNGDGVRDPNNAYDAALAAAQYLCRAVPAGGLDAEEGLRPAFFAYNHSNSYVEAVLGWTRTYAEMAPLLPPPPPPPPPEPPRRRRR